MQPPHPPTLLTIGGSDSGGAAGIQADLKTFTTLGVYGMSVLTTVTAQNSLIVQDIHSLPPEFVQTQLDTVLSDYGADGIKTGFIGNVDLIKVIAGNTQLIQLCKNTPFVVDPVLVNHKGEAMFADKVTTAYVDYLFPLAALITPNWAEAQLLVRTPVPTPNPYQIAQKLHQLGAKASLITGIPHQNNLLDLFYDGQTFTKFSSPKIETDNTHGSGDTLSAGIATFLAKKKTLPQAINQSRQFTQHAIQTAANWQLGTGHGPVWQGRRFEL